MSFVFVFVLKKHHLTNPCKPTQGLRGFWYYHTFYMYVQLSHFICTTIGFFEGIRAIRSIIYNWLHILEDFHSHIKHTWCLYDIQNSSLTNMLFSSPLISLNISFWIDTLCYPPSQSGWVKRSNTSIILLAALVLLEAQFSVAFFFKQVLVFASTMLLEAHWQHCVFFKFVFSFGQKDVIVRLLTALCFF